MFLAADIGGTKTEVALFERSGDGLRLVHENRFPSKGYPTFEQILTTFLQEVPGTTLEAACFGVAGTVIAGRVHTTNLAWVLEESALASTLGVPRVKLLNDLEAAAYGMLHLGQDEIVVLQAGKPANRTGNIAVIAAGTGLGEALLYWDGTHFHPIASEGGHADFGPNTPLEDELLQYLRVKFQGHVSWERVLSGPGFRNLYEFLRDRGHAPEAPEVAARMREGDPNAVISELGLAGTDPLSTRTVELFCSLYGSEAGNMALRCLAYGGVLVGGGIAPKMLPALTKGAFASAFAAKGRFGPLLHTIEVRVALNPRAPLLGAAYYALRIV
jgi:glucokinase